MSESTNSIVKINEKEEFELRGINKRTKELIELFPFEKYEMLLSNKVDEMIVMLDIIYQKTKNEVAGKFDFGEAYAIIQSFNGYLHVPEIENKVVLVSHVEELILFEGLDELFNVDKDKLLHKIDRLTEAQSFAVIRMAFEAIYNEENRDFDELVKEIFGIK